jgi:hypothetical protein
MVLIIKQVKFHLPKLMLFFSAYSPLFLILAINYFEFPTVAIFDLSSMQSIIHFLLSLVTVNKITIILLTLVIIPNEVFQFSWFLYIYKAWIFMKNSTLFIVSE